MSGTAVTPRSFADAFLDTIGAPIDAGTEDFVEEWETAEGGNWRNTARYNPLNTTLQEPGSVNYQTGGAGRGVQAYKDWAQGLDATVRTAMSGLYSGVINALRNDDPQSAEQALVASPWDAGHYSSGWPTSAAAAAYAGRYGTPKSSGGGGIGDQLLNAGSDIAKLSDPVTAIGDLIGGGGKAASGIAGDVASGVGSALSPLWSDAKSFALVLAATGVGVALLVLGGYQAVKPATTRIRNDVNSAAGTVAAAAAL